MNQVKIWLHAIRPKTLIASISPVLIGTSLSLSHGVFHSTTLLFTLLTALGIQISTNLVNDYFDFIKGTDTASRKGPLRVMQAGLVSHEVMKKAILISFFLTALCSFYIILKGGFLISFLTSISMLLAVFYTAGPYPLSYLGIADLFVFFFFGPIATEGTYFLQQHHFSLDAFVAGLAPGALSSAILIMNNLRDMDEDKKAGKKTLPVRFGMKWGKNEFFFMIFIALAIPLYFVSSHPFCLLAILTLFAFTPLLLQVARCRETKGFVTLFPKTGILLLIYTIVFCLGFLL